MDKYRWIKVSKTSGRPVGPRVSYDSEALCKASCREGEKPALAKVVGRPGPFQDHLEVVKEL